MDTDCFAHPTNAGCTIVNVPAPQGTTVITASVGAGGANRPADARAIQVALNEVPVDRGGPTPTLKVDGVVGPLTIAAIRRFQRFHGTGSDGRIDPAGRTLATLNAVLDGDTPVVAAGAARTASVTAAPRRPRVPEFLPPDPAVTSLALTLLVKVRDVIRAANFRLASADRFVTTRKLTIPTDPFQANARQSLTMLDTTFGLGKLANPRPSFENIKRVFRNMDVALNRSFETAPLIAPVLFVPNTHVSMETKAAAYTSAGGAFLGPNVKLRNIGEPADRIYICRNAMTTTPVEQVRILVHELAHYVSGQPIKVVDQVSEFSMLDAASRRKFDAITPDQKVRSAEHYAFFSIVARFPRFLTAT